MSTLIRVRQAAFGYAHRPVIAGVDLEIGAGRFLGVVGPNGAGKTTLFRGIAGLLRPLAGEVERAGARIGYVPQRETLDPLYPLGVAEVVAMGAYGRLSGLRTLGRDERELASRWIGRVGLEPSRGDRFSSLSGGQRQRALIARALMARPNVLLLDEPTSGVDRVAQRQILELLRELRGEGIAILLVSHQLAMVRDAVERVLWVADGRAIEGDPRTMLAPEGLDRLFDGGEGAR